MGQKQTAPVVGCHECHTAPCCSYKNEEDVGRPNPADLVQAVAPPEPTEELLGSAAAEEEDGCANGNHPILRHVTNRILGQGCTYTGQACEDGKPYGLGVMRWANGTHSGSWKAGVAHGRGRLQRSDGCQYEGEWADGVKHGKGVERFVDQSHYQGKFANGAKHGTGHFEWPSGASYTGRFICGEMDGKGTFSWGDGRKYNGEWRRGKMHGEGRFDWADGNSFVGRYRDDIKHGPGVFTWADEARCAGSWQNGRQHGIGTLTNARGIPRTARWEEGVLVQWLDSPKNAHGAETEPEPTDSTMSVQRAMYSEQPRALENADVI